MEPSRHADEGGQLQLIDANRVEDEEERLDSIDKLISPEINAGDVKKLKDAEIYTCSDLMMHRRILQNLTGIIGLSEAKVDEIFKAAEKLLNQGFMTGNDQNHGFMEGNYLLLKSSQPAMAKNKDQKFANQYQIPVEVLQEGLPALLRDAPDDELRDGNLIRVATAAGLDAALAQQAPGTVLQAYIVYYIAPGEAELIETMVEKAKSKPQAVGEATAASFVRAHQAEAGSTTAAGSSFNIANKSVLQAKVLAVMAIRGELNDITVKTKQVREKKEPPFYSETPFVDHGLPATKHLKPLKQTYFAMRALAGHYNIAKAILKFIDRPMFRSLLKSFPMTKVEEQKHLLDLAAEYKEEYPQYKSLSLVEIAKQLIGLVAFLDFQDKKRLMTSTDLAATSSDRSRVLKLLKRQKQKFRDMMDKQSLIGAEFVNFQML